MSIANELSSDVARAVLERQETAVERGTRSLTEIVLQVHSTLRLLTKEARRHRLSNLLPMPPLNNSAASSGH